MTIVFVPLVFLGLSQAIADDNGPERLPWVVDAEKQAAQELKHLLDEREFAKMLEIPAVWRTKLSERAQKKLVVMLLEELRSEKPLALKNYEDKRFLIRVDPKEQHTNPRHIVVRHGVFTVGGRCAWALEELLYTEFPPTVFSEDAKRTLKKEELDRLAQRCVQITYRRVIEAMNMPTDITALSLDGRLKLAQSPETRQKLLAALAKDSNPKVRIAVATNYRTPSAIMLQLQQDMNPLVREAAMKPRGAGGVMIPFDD